MHNLSLPYSVGKDSLDPSPPNLSPFSLSFIVSLSLCLSSKLFLDIALYLSLSFCSSLPSFFRLSLSLSPSPPPPPPVSSFFLPISSISKLQVSIAHPPAHLLQQVGHSSASPQPVIHCVPGSNQGPRQGVCHPESRRAGGSSLVSQVWLQRKVQCIWRLFVKMATDEYLKWRTPADLQPTWGHSDQCNPREFLHALRTSDFCARVRVCVCVCVCVWCVCVCVCVCACLHLV